MAKKRRMLIGGVLILFIFAGFLVSVVDQGIGALQYYHSLDEFEQARLEGKVEVAQGLRLNGMVAPGTINKDLKGMRITFDLTDGTYTVPVILTRLDVSDLFKDNANVVVEGRLGADGVFVAENLMTKCPTKYEAAEGSPSPSSE